MEGKSNFASLASRRTSLASRSITLTSGPLTARANNPEEDESDFSSRIPIDVVEPIEYHVEIELLDYFFTARTFIFVDVKKPTNTIQLHAFNLQFLAVEFVSEAGVFRATSIEQHDNESVIFGFENEIPVSSRLEKALPGAPPQAPPLSFLKIVYKGETSKNENWGRRNGLLTRSYMSKTQNRLCEALFTQFEPCDSRSVFPGWDQPSTKAHFKLDVIVPHFQMVLSNTPLEKVEDLVMEGAHHKKRYFFERTPKMSSFLIAIAVGEFEHLEKTISWPDWKNRGFPYESTQLRVFTPTGKQDEGRYVLDLAEKVLLYFTEKFQVPYSLPKLDLISSPWHPSLGMENWGLIVFHEEYFLVNSKTPFSRKQRIARLVAHEIAHQWFGDLATMEWWDNLWLKEGFARFLEYNFVDETFPEWGYWSHFLLNIFEEALHLDSKSSSHPIHVPVSDPQQITSIYDGISYGKGASVLRMLSNFVGKDVLWRALHIFLTKYSFASAVGSDLWACFQQALNEQSASIDPVVAGFDLSQTMTHWVETAGHPHLSVEYDEASHRLHIKRKVSNQKKDHLPVLLEIRDGVYSSATKSTDGNDSKRTTKRAILTEVETSIELGTSIKPEEADLFWVKVNWNNSGVYRVNYSPDLWRRLGAAVLSGDLPLVDRTGLLCDIIFFFNHLQVHPTVFLDFLQNYRNETDFDLWQFLLKNLRTLGYIYLSQEWFPKFASYVNRLCEPLFVKLGAWENINSAEKSEETLELRDMRRSLNEVLYLCKSDLLKKKALDDFSQFNLDSLYSQTAEIKLRENLVIPARPKLVLNDSNSYALSCILSFGVGFGDEQTFQKALQLYQRSKELELDRLTKKVLADSHLADDLEDDASNAEQPQVSIEDDSPDVQLFDAHGVGPQRDLSSIFFRSLWYTHDENLTKTAYQLSTDEAVKDPYCSWLGNLRLALRENQFARELLWNSLLAETGNESPFFDTEAFSFLLSGLCDSIFALSYEPENYNKIQEGFNTIASSGRLRRQYIREVLSRLQANTTFLQQTNAALTQYFQ